MSIQKKIKSILFKYKEASRAATTERTHLISTRKKLRDVEEALSIAQIVAESIQRKAHKQIADVVTDCIQTVFGTDYSFQIRFEKKRGRTEAKLLLLYKRHVIEDPLNEDSGGVVDVAAFGLRLAGLLLIKPKPRRTLRLDEPFKFVSEEYREGVRNMLVGISESLKIQIIMVTHIRGLQLGKIVQL